MSSTEKIPCGVCGVFYKIISNTHLRYKHGMEMEEYRRLFPGAPIESPAIKKHLDKVRKENANTKTALLARSETGKKNKGSKRTEEFKKKRSDKYKGSGNPFYNKTHSLETRQRLSAHFQGVSKEEWQGFRNSEAKRAWKSKRAKRWSQEVFQLDDYTCALCGLRGGDLEAHHITPRAKAPERTYDLTNGITLCVSCHRKTFGQEAHFEEGLRAAVSLRNSKSLK